MPEYDETIPVYLDALLRPNKSLSHPGFIIFMMIFGAFSFFTGMMYLSLGAFPIVGFLAIGAVGLWIAFKLCFKYQASLLRGPAFIITCCRTSPATLEFVPFWSIRAWCTG